MFKLITFLFLLLTSNVFGQGKLDKYDKGEFRLKLGLPYFNYLYLQPDNEDIINRFGFIGESIGLEYSFNDKNFLEVGFSLMGVSDNPLPIQFKKGGEYQSQYSVRFGLTNNHNLSRFTVGYGVNYSLNTYTYGFRNFSVEDTTPTTYNHKTNRNLGLNLNTYYRATNSFNLGLVYRPSVLLFKDGFKTQYEHSLSLELLWRIRLNNRELDISD